MTYIRFFLTICIVALCLPACDGPSANKISKSGEKSTGDTIAIKLELVTTGVETPIEYNVSPDDSHRVYITDVNGKIWILQNDSLYAKPFLNIFDKIGPHDKKTGIGAISSVAFHPSYASNGKFYVCYNMPAKIKSHTCTLVVSEFTNRDIGQPVADLSTERRVIEFDGKNIGANGSQIRFGPDGFLYISVGDDGIGDSAYVYKAQNLKYFNGKLLRIDVDQIPYGVPADNPFVSVKDAKPEIWAYGFRKMWRFCFEPKTNLLFGADVGQDKEEEIDLVTKGGNYGWPVSEGDSSFKNDGASGHPEFIAPIDDYVRTVGICVIGGDFYHGSGIPLLKDKYVFGDFNGSMFVLVKDEKGNWERKPVKISNKGEELFLICGFGVNEVNELIVMGLLNTKTGQKGAVYRILKA